MINEKYSYKDFMGQDFSSVDASEFNNTEIVGSCFYQEAEPDTEVFPANMTGATFKRCNLDNVKIPAGNTVESDCSTRRVKTQNDLEDWVLDGSNDPIEPTNKKKFIELGLSIDPGDIPADFIREELLTKNEYNAIKDNADFKQWFIDTPIIDEQKKNTVAKLIKKSKWDAEADKSIWTKDYDSPPAQKETSLPVTGFHVPAIELKGDVTTYHIKAKGKYIIKGVKPRLFNNKSVTQAAREAQI